MREEKKYVSWRVLKFSKIALYSEWENGTLMQMKTFLERGSQSWMFILIFFLQSFEIRRLICDLHPISLNKVWRTEQCRVLCVPSPRQDRVPGSDYLWKVQESTEGVLGRKEPGGLRREPGGGKVQSMCSEQQWSWEEFSHTLKSNRITASKDFSISPVNKGTDQRKSPVWIVCLGSSSSRSSTLRGDSRRYKQKSISWYFN